MGGMRDRGKAQGEQNEILKGCISMPVLRMEFLWTKILFGEVRPLQLGSD